MAARKITSSHSTNCYPTRTTTPLQLGIVFTVVLLLIGFCVLAGFSAVTTFSVHATSYCI